MNSALKRRTYVIQAFLTVLAVFWLYPITQSLIQSFRLDGIGNYIKVLRNPADQLSESADEQPSHIRVRHPPGSGPYRDGRLRVLEDDLQVQERHLLLAAGVPFPASRRHDVAALFHRQADGADEHLRGSGLARRRLPGAVHPASGEELLRPDPGFPARGGGDRRSLVAPDPFRRGRPDRPAGADQRRRADIHQFLERVLPSSDFPSNDSGKYTIPLTANYYMSTMNQTPRMVAQMYAALILMTLPSIIVYLVAQNNLQVPG